MTTTRIDTRTIPGINLEAFVSGSNSERKAIAEQVDATCRTIGFLVIDGHGVPKIVCDAAWSAARQFFDLPLEEKLATRSSEPGCPRGYFPVEGETLAKTRGESSAPDPKEAFSSGPPTAPAGHESAEDFDFFYGPNIWPAALPEFEGAWLDYYRAMETLGAKVMTLLAAALRLDDNFFVPFHSHHISALRGINYPSMPMVSAAGNSRAGAHSDWIRAPSVEDAFVVNIGDLMAHWTNGRWVSTLHRVVAPNDDPVPRRQSIAYFMNPNYDAEIRAIPTCRGDGSKSATVTAGRYLIDKFRSALQTRFTSEKRSNTPDVPSVDGPSTTTSSVRPIRPR